MIKLFEELQQAIDGVGAKYLTVAEPHEPVPTGGVVIGTVGTELQKLFTLSWMYRLMSQRLGLEALLSDTPQESLRVAKPKGIELLEKAELLQELFWIEVQDLFQQWGRDSLGIRQGWKIVALSPSASPAQGSEEEPKVEVYTKEQALAMLKYLKELLD